MGPVTLERAGRGLQIQLSGSVLPAPSSPDSPGLAWRALPHTDTFSVRSLLREFVLSDQDCRGLHELIRGSGSLGTSPLNNAKLVDTVAELVAARRLVILERGDGTAKQTGMRAASVKHTPSAPAFTPAQLRPPPAPPPAQAPQALLEESIFANVDQAAQAATLQAAAANGVPFCEVCDKGKR